MRLFKNIYPAKHVPALPQDCEIEPASTSFSGKINPGDSVLVGFAQQDFREYLWLYVHKKTFSGKLHCLVDNYPKLITGLSLGDPVTVGRQHVIKRLTEQDYGTAES